MNDTRAAAEPVLPQAESSKDNTGTGGDFEMLRLVQRLFLASTGNVPRQVVFTGVGSDNGSAQVCVSAAKTLAASSSRSVCLVDADFRSPRLADLLGVKAGERPAQSATARERCVEVRENLWLADPGLLQDNGGALASASQLRATLEELRGAFEFVLLSGARADLGGEALILAQLTQGAILVIEAEVTRRIAARKVKESFDTAHVRLLGTVLRNRSYPIPSYLYDRL